MAMRWQCMECETWFKKTEKKIHEDKTDHIFHVRGERYNLDTPKVSELEIAIPELSAPIDVPMDLPLFEFTGEARKDYPQTYKVLDIWHKFLRGQEV